jgi:hypothetical protein
MRRKRPSAIRNDLVHSQAHLPVETGGGVTAADRLPVSVAGSGADPRISRMTATTHPTVGAGRLSNRSGSYAPALGYPSA